jgi:hypothetical protein
MLPLPVRLLAVSWLVILLGRASCPSRLTCSTTARSEHAEVGHARSESNSQQWPVGRAGPPAARDPVQLHTVTSVAILVRRFSTVSFRCLADRLKYK